MRDGLSVSLGLGPACRDECTVTRAESRHVACGRTRPVQRAGQEGRFQGKQLDTNLAHLGASGQHLCSRPKALYLPALGRLYAKSRSHTYTPFTHFLIDVFIQQLISEHLFCAKALYLPLRRTGQVESSWNYIPGTEPDDVQGNQNAGLCPAVRKATLERAVGEALAEGTGVCVGCERNNA